MQDSTLTGPRRWPPSAWVAVAVFIATIGQLMAAWALQLPQFQAKAFGARLISYPLMMLAVPVAWWVFVGRRRERPGPIPWVAFALWMLSFCLDVTGNTLDLFDSITWFDDAMHFVNWFLINAALGLLLFTVVRPPWAVVVGIGGLGALLALGWELAEWYTFIRHGTELDTAYTDTLGDMTLGTLGSLLAGGLVAWWLRRAGRLRGGATPVDDAAATLE